MTLADDVKDTALVEGLDTPELLAESMRDISPFGRDRDVRLFIWLLVHALRKTVASSIVILEIGANTDAISGHVFLHYDTIPPTYLRGGSPRSSTMG